MSDERKIKDGPFCWQSKKVLRFIRDCFDETNNVASALAVYLSLTEKASDTQSETFDCRVRDIAARADVSYRTAMNALLRFETLGIISIRRNCIANTKERAPSTYTLLRLGNDCPRLGNGRKQPSLPRKIEESPEEIAEKFPRTHSNKLETHHSAEWRFNYLVEELEIIDLYNQICVPRGWRVVNTYSEELQKALETFCDSGTDDFRTMFETAADERDAGEKIYNTRLGNKLIRILWSNY
jgi:hypothetical protein